MEFSIRPISASSLLRVSDIFLCQIPTDRRGVNPVLGFLPLAICVREFADEMSFVTPFRPGFRDLRPTDREDRLA